MCAWTGHCVNLLKRVHVLLGGNNRIQTEKPGTALFSGFLIAFLGVSGIQAEIPENFTMIKNQKDSAAVESACPKKESLASLEIASATFANNKETEKSGDESKECKAEKSAHKVLKEETKIPTNKEAQAVFDMKEAKDEEYKKRVAELEKLLKGYPLQKMAPEIAKLDPEIAALVVGIARKESQWGLRSPKKNGDCFNYWGYKGAGGRGVGMGYACFATREEAVEKIAARLEKLVQKRGSSKPNILVTPWKCGNSCATHSPESVRKWVSDVNQYYTKVLAMK